MRPKYVHSIFKSLCNSCCTDLKIRHCLKGTWHCLKGTWVLGWRGLKSQGNNYILLQHTFLGKMTMSAISQSCGSKQRHKTENILGCEERDSTNTLNVKTPFWPGTFSTKFILSLQWFYRKKKSSSYFYN